MGDLEIAVAGVMAAMNDAADAYKAVHGNVVDLIECLHQRDLALVYYARLYPLVDAEDLIAAVGRQQVSRGTEQ
jgi:hypothetical protein